MIGKKILHYEVTEKIGAGGMGEVYRARDTKLGRDVALKVLPEAFTQDLERLARFEREAQVLASLNHAHIASIHGLEHSDSTRFLVLEFVAGEDLAQRLSRGAIPVSDTIDMCRQIAEALEEAHDQGVVHRDLKPANIKVNPDGMVKVLDFGLAKALEGDTGSSSTNLTQSPTMMSSRTVEGVILGTAAYMSPEQARGKRVDRRSDIWSFGCVLFEMLTGKQLFSGETVSDTMAAVLRAEVPFDALPSSTPRALRRLLERCLDRDVRKRLQSIGEARILLERVLAGDEPEEGQAVSPGSPSRQRLLWGLVGIAAGAVITFFGVRSLAPPAFATVEQAVRLEIPLHRGGADVRFAFDQAGTKVVFSNNGRLFIRRLDQVEAREVPNTAGAVVCTWSPDGEWIAYSNGPKLYKIRPDGSQRVQVCDVPQGMHPRAGGIIWLTDGTMVFSTGDAGLFQVSDGGGNATELLAPAEGEVDFHAVNALPDDRGFLFVPHTPNAMSTVALFANGERTVVVDHEDDLLGQATYSRGHVLYNRSRTNPGLWAIPFDLERLQSTGDPFLVEQSAGGFAVSGTGHLAYASRVDDQQRELVVMNGSGNVKQTVVEGQLGMRGVFSLSPDGEQVAVSLADEDGDIWVYGIKSGVRQRFAFGSENQRDPAWSPDGKQIVYIVGSLGEAKLISQDASGATTRELPGGGMDYCAFSPDGEYLVLNQRDEALDNDIATMTMGGEPILFLDTPASERFPALSPGNGYLAYQSDESGHDEIFIRTFPDGESVWQVSQDGGQLPHWSRDGTRLYFQNDAKFMEVEVGLGATLRLGPPQVRFEDDTLVNIVPGRGPDEFVAVRSVTTNERPPALTVWLNWSTGLGGR